jgi:hypothetical protein
MAVIRKKPDVSLSTGLKIGFTLLLSLLIALTMIGLMEMAAINRHIEHIVQENNVKNQLANDMRYALSDRAIIAHSIALMSDAFEQQDAFDRFNEDATIFTHARIRFLEMPQSAAEKKILADMRHITLKTQPLVMHVVNQAMGGENAQALTLMATQVVPLQRMLSAQIDDLIKLQEGETRLSVQKAAATYANTRLWMVFMGTVAILLGLIIAMVVIRHTNRQAALLQYQAMYDSLTLLPNRVLFADRLQQAILVGRRENSHSYSLPWTLIISRKSTIPWDTMQVTAYCSTLLHVFVHVCANRIRLRAWAATNLRFYCRPAVISKARCSQPKKS